MLFLCRGQLANFPCRDNTWINFSEEGQARAVLASSTIRGSWAIDDPGALQKRLPTIVRSCGQFAAQSGLRKLFPECGPVEEVWGIRPMTRRFERIKIQSRIRGYRAFLERQNVAVLKMKSSPVASFANSKDSGVYRWKPSENSAEKRESNSCQMPSETPLGLFANQDLASAETGGTASLSSQSEEKFSGETSLPSSALLRAIENSQFNLTIPGASLRVAVIGAGAGGLVAARELVREGHEVVVFEQGNEVGGIWLYDPRVESDLLGVDPSRSRLHGSMYESLRVNLPREVMGFIDFPFLPKEGEGRDSRRFCNHREVAQYLKDFAEEYNIRELVKFSVKVEYVGQEKFEGAGKKWVVKSRKFNEGEQTGSQECRRENLESNVFDAVVICNGHYSNARVVQIPGVENWPGLQIHSHNYRVPDRFKDQVVVVIGNASSGQDLTSEIAVVAKEVHQCARAWPSKDLLAGGGPRNNQWQHPMVEKACPDGTVMFQDESSVKADVILYCTGFLYSFPFLDTHGYITVDDNRVDPLYKHVFPPALAPNLSFVGLPMKVAPFPVMELQSSWIAKALSGQAKLPLESAMKADTQNLYEKLEAKDWPKSYTHICGDYQSEYMDWLVTQSGHEPVETWRGEIYATTSKNRSANPGTYRDQWHDQDIVEVAVASLQKRKYLTQICLDPLKVV